MFPSVLIIGKKLLIMNDFKLHGVLEIVNFYVGIIFQVLSNNFYFLEYFSELLLFLRGHRAGGSGAEAGLNT